MITAPYQRGSETSRAAAMSIEHLVETQMEKVYSLISESPRTDQEVAKILGVQISSVTARRRALVLGGKVRDSGKRKSNPSGRSAVVWTAGYQKAEAGLSRETLQKWVETLQQRIDRADAVLSDVSDGLAIKAQQILRGGL